MSRHEIDGNSISFFSTMDPLNDDGFFTQLLHDRDPNLLNDLVTTIPTPQTTTEGTSKKTQRGVNFVRKTKY